MRFPDTVVTEDCTEAMLVSNDVLIALSLACVATSKLSFEIETELSYKPEPDRLKLTDIDPDVPGSDPVENKVLIEEFI